MTYMLDTDTFSNLVHSHGKVELRYALVGATATCISTITVQEIEFGRWLHPERMRRLNSRIDVLIASAALTQGPADPPVPARYPPQVIPRTAPGIILPRC
jgi:hypothetical protein